MSENKIDIEQVKRVAALGRLALSEDEIAKLSNELSSILGYIEKLNTLDTDGVEPLAHCLAVKNVLGEDVVAESLGTEKALANAPAKDGEFFKVPKILEDGAGA